MMRLERREMKKKDKKEAEFLRYQKFVYAEFEKIIEKGWNEFDFNMPPEFLLPLSLYNIVLKSDKLTDEAKHHWVKGQKFFWKNEKNIFKIEKSQNGMRRKPILH